MQMRSVSGQVWTMTDGAVLWRVSPPLFYATVNEIWRRVVARHGAAPVDDTDVRLVRKPPRTDAERSGIRDPTTLWLCRLGWWPCTLSCASM